MTKVGRLFGERVTWKTAWVISASPPTMSMWMTARARAASSGRALSSAIVPSISGGQTKRIVRRGGGIFPVAISLASVAAGLQDRGAAAGVVVGPRPLVVQVAGEHDLLASLRTPGITAVAIA